MSECPLSGRGQGHVSNFCIVDIENFATASRRYTGDIHNSSAVGLFMTPVAYAGFTPRPVNQKAVQGEEPSRGIINGSAQQRRRRGEMYSLHSAKNLTEGACNRSTQPCIPPGSLNRVPASAGVKAGMSPLPGGRQH